MNWSWTVGRIKGIAIAIHALFPVLVLWSALSTYRESGSLYKAADAALFIIILFSIVVLHELGHALTAAKFGIRTRSITLLPIGGVATMESMPDKPWQEFLVAIAGPAVNVGLALICFALLQIFPQPETSEIIPESLLTRLFYVNVGLAIFNLLPAFPMDGGRVLRALLAMRLDFAKATKIAANIGKGFAILMAFVGLNHNPMLIFIAVFIWFGANQETQYAQAKSAFTNARVKDAMLTHFRVLPPEAGLDTAAALFLDGSQTEVPVVDNNRLVGIITQQALIEAMARGLITQSIGSIMQPMADPVSSETTLENVLPSLQASLSGCLPVLNQEQIVGLLTMRNVSEFLAFRQIKVVRKL
jgi:Zn-dependent protease/CBS domain-containing protein